MSWFSLASVSLHGWQLRVDESLATLLSELLLAQVPMPEIDLKLVDVHDLHSGKAMNALCGLDGASVGRVEAIGIHETTILPFIQACSSMMEARSPSRLALYKAFGHDRLERPAKWRWLGYALLQPTSIRHLRIDDERLTASDVRHFIGDHRACRYLVASPPASASVKQSISLASDASILVSGKNRYSLETLGITDSDKLVIVDDYSPDGDTMQVLVPGFGVCEIPCDSIIDASSTPASTSPSFNLLSFDCGINTCEPEALSLLSRSIGSTLVRLRITIGEELVLSRSDAESFVAAFPVLELLDVNHVTFGSMDVLQNAYDQHQWRVGVLSMTNSFVDPTSMTRFACRLQDPLAPVTQRLREFRFIFEDYHASVNGGCTEIVTSDGAAAFRDALHRNTVLTFIDIGLVQPVYDAFYTTLSAFDKSTTSESWRRSKLAFLSATQGVPPTNTLTKEPKLTNLHIPVEHRRHLVHHIWSFLQAPKQRVVSVICVPRR